MLSAKNFDRDFSLTELLPAAALASLQSVLARLLGKDALLRDAADGAPAGKCAPVRWQLETVAYVVAECAEEGQLRAAAALTEMLLHAHARYRMAADLHVQAVQEDYRELQAKHSALQESEARYRQLAQNLEQRVREQVKTIEAAQSQLYQAEKMASVGQLAAGVAHEINNPIGFIRSNLGTAQEYVEKLGRLAPLAKGDGKLGAAWQENDLDYVLEDFAHLLQESISGADRVARIVADLKDFSSVDRAGEEAVDLNACLRAVCNVAESRVKPHAEVMLDLGEIPPIPGNAGRLNQVFLNLLLNAAQAMKERGEIRLRSWLDSGEIVVRVADNGAGIPPEALPRIFDPFFTTRDVGQGTGLGLTVCRDIVRAHGGRIEVQSAAGKGTTVNLYFPVKENRNGTSAAAG